jgi:hypothetical protein
VAELAAGVAFHRLRLAVASKVVRTAALIAGRRTGCAGESAADGPIAAAADDAASAKPSNRGVGTVALKGSQHSFRGSAI